MQGLNMEEIRARQRRMRVVRHVGEGMTGEVFLVESDQDAPPRALKLLHPTQMTPTRVAAFKREFATLAQLHHPHLAQVYDFGLAESHGRYFFTSDYIEGEQFYAALADASLRERLAAVSQILDLLDLIHNEGLLHLDVKGANILVAWDRGWPHATLIDFGFTMPQVTPLEGIYGTIQYIPPEMFLRTPHADHRSDLYSLGVILYRLFAGRYPVEDSTFHAIHTWHQRTVLDTQPLCTTNTPDYVVQLIESLLQPDPNRRFSSAAAILKYLALHSDQQYTLPQRKARRILLHEGPLVGRDSLVRAWQADLERLRSGERAGAIVPATLIRGASGMGKTRLLHDFRLQSQLAECETDAYVAPRDNAAITRRLAEITAHVPTTPHVIVIDDIDQLHHEAQTALSQCIQRFYAQRVHGRPTPVALICALRPESPAPTPVGCREIVLAPLTQIDVEQFVTRLFGPDENIGDWTARLFTFSEGIPLLLREALALANDPAQPLPASITEVYEAQLHNLSRHENDILAILALTQQPLGPTHINHILTETVDDAIAALHRRQLTIDEHTHITLASGALRDLIVARLEPTTRMQWMDRLLAWSLTHDATNVVAQAAYAAQGTDPDRGINYAIAAAETVRHADIGAAIGYYDAAAQGLTVHDPRHPEVLQHLRQLHLLRGDIQGVSATFADVDIDAVTDVDTLKTLAWVERLKRRPHHEAVFLDRALACIDHDMANPAFLILRNERAQAHMEMEEWIVAEQLFQENFEAAGTLPSDLRKRVVNNNLGTALAQRGDVENALAFYDTKLAHFREDPRLCASIWSQRAFVALRAGRRDEAYQNLHEAWRMAVHSGAIHVLLSVSSNLIPLAQERGDFRLALEMAEESLAHPPASANDYGLGHHLLALANLHLALHNLRSAHQLLADARTRFAAADSRVELGWCHLTEGYLAKDNDHFDAAGAAFEAALAVAEKTADTDLASWSRFALADNASMDNRPDDAIVWLTRLNHHSQSLHPTFPLRMALVKSQIALLQGDQDAIEEQFDGLTAWADQAETQCWQELLWETYYYCGALARHHQATEVARTWLEKADAAFCRIVGALPEEFREGYRQHPQRIALESALGTLPAPLPSVAQPQQHLQRASRHLGMPYRIKQRSSPMDTTLPMELVLQISHQLASERDPERLIQLILDHAIELLEAERGLLLRPQDDGFSVALARNIDASESDALQFSQTIARKVAQRGSPLMTRDAPHDSTVGGAQSVAALQLQTVVCLPLLFRGRLYGLIYLDSRRETAPIDTPMEMALGYFADQAAVALANGQLVQRLEEARREAESALEDQSSDLTKTREELESLHAAINEAQSRRETRYRYENIIGNSPAMVRVLRVLDKVTETNAPIFIHGETGTGKELIAKAIHFNNSHRKTRQFVAINCAAFPEQILESELFGYCKGAFTGADRDKPGLFELASGGTLFLDEIGDMPVTMQAKVLRAIQEQEVMRLGGKAPIKVDVRLVSASNRDLKRMIVAEDFRSDLYYRVAGITVDLPPLRTRKEDLPLLIQFFLQMARKEHGLRSRFHFAPAAMQVLLNYTWPGNVRQLEQTVANAIILADQPEITPPMLPPLQDAALPELTSLVETSESIRLTFDPKKPLKSYEEEIIKEALTHHEGNKSQTALALGISRMTLLKKLKSYGLQ
jgi:transcriptional regulator with GAF, ATPase, and Fis domain